MTNDKRLAVSHSLAMPSKRFPPGSIRSVVCLIRLCVGEVRRISVSQSDFNRYQSNMPRVSHVSPFVKYTSDRDVEPTKEVTGTEQLSTEYDQTTSEMVSEKRINLILLVNTINSPSQNKRGALQYTNKHEKRQALG